MIRETLMLSALIAAILLVRAVFKNRVPKRMIYALWLVVLLKLCLPGTLFSLPVLPAEQTAAPVQRAEFPAQTAPVTSGCLAHVWSLRSGCAKAGNSSEDTEKPVFTSQAASRRPALQASSRPSI